ncbi:MAG: hypothetical protein ACRCV9_04425, partial [Burkholderiaceae bacterium]
MTPLQSNRFWATPDTPEREQVRAALQALKPGQRLRLADAVRLPELAQGEDSEKRESAPEFVEYISVALRAADLDEETREIDLSFSSEEPYERWWGVEVLGHEVDEIDMSWLASGRAPMLADHDMWVQIGVVRSALVGVDRKGRARVKFGKSERARQEMQDVKDGVRVNVSVGYEIIELELVKVEGDVRIYRVT